MESWQARVPANLCQHSSLKPVTPLTLSTWLCLELGTRWRARARTQLLRSWQFRKDQSWPYTDFKLSLKLCFFHWEVKWTPTNFKFEFSRTIGRHWNLIDFDYLPYYYAASSDSSGWCNFRFTVRWIWHFSAAE